MGSKTCSSLFLTLNLLFFAVVSAHGPCPGPNPNPNPKPKPRPTSLSGGSNTLEASSCPRDELKLSICANLLRSTSYSLLQPHRGPSWFWSCSVPLHSPQTKHFGHRPWHPCHIQLSFQHLLKGSPTWLFMLIYYVKLLYDSRSPHISWS